MLTCFDVANYFLSIGDADDMTNLKLQKMVYFAQGHCLAKCDERLYNEDIEAWVNGPVIPELYNEYKKYKDNSIPAPENFNYKIVKDKRDILDAVHIEYGQYDAITLLDMTHIKSSPWYAVFYDETKNFIINDHLMRIFFSEVNEHKTDKRATYRKISNDSSLIETMFVFAHPKGVQELLQAMKSSKNNEGGITIEDIEAYFAVRGI